MSVIPLPPELSAAGTLSLAELHQEFAGLSPEVCNSLLQEAGVGWQARLPLLRELANPTVAAEAGPPAWYRTIPVLNVFCTLAWGEPASVDGVRSLVDLLALVSALTLTVIVGVPLSIDSGGYADAVAKFTEGEYADCEADGYNFIEQLNAFSTKSMMMTSACFFGALTFLFFLGFYTFKTHAALVAWWRVARGVVILGFVCMVWGLADLLNAWRMFMVLTMPNPYILEHGCPAGASVMGMAANSPFDVANTWVYTGLMSSIILNLSYVLPILVLGVAMVMAERA